MQTIGFSAGLHCVRLDGVLAGSFLEAGALGDDAARAGVAGKGRDERIVFLLYRSVSKFGPNRSEAAALRAQCIRRNAAEGISGYLHHEDGMFAQYVEGTPEAVDALERRLRADPRHADIDVLDRGAAPFRRFRGWSMAAASGMTPIAALREAEPDAERIVRLFEEGCITLALRGMDMGDPGA